MVTFIEDYTKKYDLALKQKDLTVGQRNQHVNNSDSIAQKYLQRTEKIHKLLKEQLQYKRDIKIIFRDLREALYVQYKKKN